MRSHNNRGLPADIVDRSIAAQYTGLDRAHLRFLRRHCSECTHGTGTPVPVVLDTPGVRKFIEAAREVYCSTTFGANIVEGTRREAHGLSPLNADAEMDCSTVRRTSSHYSQVIWVGCQDRTTKMLPTQVLQLRHTAARYSRLVPNCFRPEVAKQIMSKTGPGYLELASSTTTAHQSIVVVAMLAEIASCKIDFGTLEWLQSRLIDRRPAFDQNTLLLLASHAYDAPDVCPQKVCRLIAQTSPTRLRTFPSVAEMEYASRKTGDIKALDSIAEGAPHCWAFRPKTCYSNAECSITTKGVLKRSNSHGSNHVMLNPTATDLARLSPCKRSGRTSARRDSARRTSKRQAEQ